MHESRSTELASQVTFESVFITFYVFATPSLIVLAVSLLPAECFLFLTFVTLVTVVHRYQPYPFQQLDNSKGMNALMHWPGCIAEGSPEWLCIAFLLVPPPALFNSSILLEPFCLLKVT
jgi:hypothetical protein